MSNARKPDGILRKLLRNVRLAFGGGKATDRALIAEKVVARDQTPRTAAVAGADIAADSVPVMSASELVSEGL